jgi:hypothetical protein
MATNRKALIVGIDYYEHFDELLGCANDARNVNEVLKRHEVGNQKNFGTKVLIATNAKSKITRKKLRKHIEELFKFDGEIALLYFAGHGHVEEAGGFILASDSEDGSEGIALNDVLTWANQSEAKNRIVVLDSCFSGAVGALPTQRSTSQIAEGTTLLTASAADQYADEVNGSGVFTSLFVNALKGAAANLVGKVSPGAVYAHIDQSLCDWEPRPVFKTNIKEFVSLRNVNPKLSVEQLHRLIEFFPAPDDEFKLDPTFEPELRGRKPGMPAPIKANTKKFAVLQEFNRNGLVVPEGAPHLWHAAMKRKGVKLTELGMHYRRLVEKDLI